MTHNPFGSNSAEDELPILRELYFTRLAHHREVLERDVSLILGRRGSGKTALGAQLQYSKVRSDGAKHVYDVYVDVNEPKIFSEVLNKMQQSVGHSQARLTETVANLWRASLWFALAHEVAKAPGFADTPGSAFVDRLCRGRNVFGKTASSIVRTIIQAILQKLGSQATQTERLADEIATLLSDESFVQTRKVITAFFSSNKQRAAIVIDTLEEYRISDLSARVCISALVHAACVPAQDDLRFPAAVEVKCFLPAELYGALEPDLLNIGKYEGHCHYMHWRRKDLLRMISWRYLWYLENRKAELADPTFAHFRKWDWEDYEHIRRTFWDKIFPAPDNLSGAGFDSFAYVTRYTQLRPRQMIWLCNSIAKSGTPALNLSWTNISNAVASTAPRLAAEVLNAFKEVYPGAIEIVKALAGADEYLTYGDVDERAHRTKAQWAAGTYDRVKFWRFLIESGVLGIVEERKDRFTETRYEYIVKETLTPTENDQFAIHPMFHRYLTIKKTKAPPQYPLGPEDLKD